MIVLIEVYDLHLRQVGNELIVQKLATKYKNTLLLLSISKHKKVWSKHPFVEIVSVDDACKKFYRDSPKTLYMQLLRTMQCLQWYYYSASNS